MLHAKQVHNETLGERGWGSLLVLGAGRVELGDSQAAAVTTSTVETGMLVSATAVGHDAAKDTDIKSDEAGLLARLSSLGFEEAQARPVLGVCGGDVERAVELILQQDSAAAAASANAAEEGVPPAPATMSPQVLEFLVEHKLSTRYTAILEQAGLTTPQSLAEHTIDDLLRLGFLEFHARRFLRQQHKLTEHLDLEQTSL